MVSEASEHLLSAQQRRCCQLRNDRNAYRAKILISIEGDVDSKRLHESLGTLVERHEILRTILDDTPAPGRVPVQVVLHRYQPVWCELIWSDLPNSEHNARIRDLLRMEALEVASPGSGLRATHIQLRRDWSELVISVPSHSADPTSLDILASELSRAYKAEP